MHACLVMLVDLSTIYGLINLLGNIGSKKIYLVILSTIIN